MSGDLVLAVASTALLSSVLTLVGVALGGRWLLARRVAALLDQAGPALAARARAEVEAATEAALPRLREAVRRGLEEGAAEVLPRLRGEVGAGLTEAAEPLLPRFRAEVREGFREAVAESLSGKGLARTGSSVLEAGLKAIFGDDEGKR